jgi:hypothetical protein
MESVPLFAEGLPRSIQPSALADAVTCEPQLGGGSTVQP